jgi:hypothetical protein
MTPLPSPLLLAVADDVIRLVPHLTSLPHRITAFQSASRCLASTRVCPRPVAGRSLRASCPSLTARRLRFAGHRSAAGGLVAAALAAEPGSRGTGSPSPRRSPVAQVVNLCLPIAPVAQVVNLCLPIAPVAQVVNLCPSSVAQVFNLCPPVVRPLPPSSPAGHRKATPRGNHGGAS